MGLMNFPMRVNVNLMKFLTKKSLRKSNTNIIINRLFFFEAKKKSNEKLLTGNLTTKLFISNSFDIFQILVG